MASLPVGLGLTGTFDITDSNALGGRQSDGNYDGDGDSTNDVDNG